MAGRPLLILVLLGVLAATSDAATTGGAIAAKRVQGREASHVLFGAGRVDGGGEGRRRALLTESGGISYSTLTVVAHPLRADMSQKKVQQTHAGLELFGHTFVVGLAEDGVTEQAEGTFGSVFTDLGHAIPDTTPSITPAAAVAAAMVAAAAPSGTATSSKLVIWVDKEETSVHHAAHLAYFVTLSARALSAYALVDARDGQLLRTWREQSTKHTPRPRPLPDTVTSGPAPCNSHPLTMAGPTRSLQQSKGTIVNAWAIGGNVKVGRIYYNGTNGQPQLQVTKTGDNCSFLNTYTKTGDIRQVYTMQELEAGVYADKFEPAAINAC